VTWRLWSAGLLSDYRPTWADVGSFIQAADAETRGQERFERTLQMMLAASAARRIR